MSLHDYAKTVARSPKSQANKALSEMRPMEAVRQCAFDSKALSGTQLALLREMDWEDDFSVFVGPSDPLVRNADEMMAVPAGAFIGFIEVVHPQAHNHYLGTRKLVHPMISLGNGLAVGCHNQNIHVGSEAGEWEIVDLADELSWIPEKNSNYYDYVSVAPLGIKVARSVRIRYRPIESLGSRLGGSQPTGTRKEHVGVWGSPQASMHLHAEVVHGAKSMKTMLIEEGRDNHKKPDDQRIYRLECKFAVAADAFEAFFNAPNELRGHYYHGTRLGDSYTKWVIRDIAMECKLEEQLRNLQFKRNRRSPLSAAEKTAFLAAINGNDQIRSNYLEALKDGRIWLDEDGTAVIGEPWQPGGQQHGAPIRIPQNNRWINEAAAAAANFDKVEAIIWSDNAGNHSSQRKKEIIDKLKSRLAFRSATDHAAEPSIPGLGSFFYRYISKHAEPNIDIKGDWCFRDGTRVGFTPLGKYYRGSQIQWFGFS